jgi:hypothetical protein
MPKKTGIHDTKKTAPALKHGAQDRTESKRGGKGGASRKMIPGAGLSGGKITKGGCLPKLALLLLPFLAIGAIISQL